MGSYKIVFRSDSDTSFPITVEATEGTDYLYVHYEREPIDLSYLFDMPKKETKKKTWVDRQLRKMGR